MEDTQTLHGVNDLATALFNSIAFPSTVLLCVCLSVCLAVCVSMGPSVCLCVSQSFIQSVCMSVVTLVGLLKSVDFLKLDYKMGTYVALIYTPS